jgi:thiosulfate dehydrogenase [quinone] large subunit
MNDSNENKNSGCCENSSKCCGDYSLAFLVLRGWLAVRAILTGVEKFGAYKTVQQPLLDENGQPDASGVLHNVSIKYYSFANYSGIPKPLLDKFANEPLLPKFALTVFNDLLGPVFILTGVMLLVGLGTRLSLFVPGLIYIALTVGLILIGQNDGISYLGIHIALVAFALVVAKNNKFAILKKW